MSQTRITIVGSINLDIVASAECLPAPGETVTGARLAQHPGGKGANQALAGCRLGADVLMVGRVGADANAKLALALLGKDGVNLDKVSIDADLPTGVALIGVDAKGENQIIVAPGSNEALKPEHLDIPDCDAMICQLEIPVETVLAAAEKTDAFFSINLAPALPVPDTLFERADLIIVNETEAAFYGEDRLARSKGLVAITYGAKGAALFQDGQELARALPPSVTALDATGAGDSFVAALTLALVRGDRPEAALRFACCVGALTATREGAQTSLPKLDEVNALMAQT